MSPRLRCFFVVLFALAGCMEGQKLDPLSRSTLYENLGGEKGISRVVDDFVATVVADDRIRAEHRKHFEKGDVPGLKRKLIEQIGEATGGPQKYTGRTMREAHKGLGITNEDFDALVDDLSRVLIRNKVSESDRKALMNLLSPMRKDIVE